MNPDPSKDSATGSTTVSHGVDELIERLRRRGIDAGREEADQLVAEARARAREITEEARREAERIRARVEAELHAERAAAEAALDLAKRNALLTLGDLLMREIAERLRVLVAGELDDHEFLRRLILALAGRARDELPGDEARAVIDLPAALFADADATDTRDTEREMIRPFILKLTRDLLREGVELRPAGIEAGFTMTLEGEAVRVDFTEEALNRLLAHHLTPRFRRLFRGID